jgi:hypothetical protein
MRERRKLTEESSDPSVGLLSNLTILVTNILSMPSIRRNHFFRIHTFFRSNRQERLSSLDARLALPVQQSDPTG